MAAARDDRLAVLQRVIHRVEPAVGADVVRIKDGHGVARPFGRKLPQPPREHVALALAGRRLLPDDRARRAGDLGRAVGAVVRQDNNLAAVGRILREQHALHRQPDDGLLVARADENGERQFPRSLRMGLRGLDEADEDNQR